MVYEMRRKKFLKYLMSIGFTRNEALIVSKCVIRDPDVKSYPEACKIVDEIYTEKYKADLEGSRQ